MASPKSYGQSGPESSSLPPYQIGQSNTHPLHYSKQGEAMDPAAGEIRGGDWESGLCDCSPCGSCCLGSFAPCLIVGRTASRLQDPTLQSPDMCNGDCMIHAGLSLLFGSGWIYTMIKRGDIRQRFGIPGSGWGDCCTAFWCQCCQIIQADNEVKARLAPMVDRNGYKQVGGMVAHQQ
ncbi:unnamed protein product [Clonostachys chloroleuca]|uniref:Uncharacterized protein n=1 Tax=Clonostachys chloroleuca TaxID=1926264 RepID=A0AA35LW91_9HYPO|nr:unnamed protein product [Clonostachys chloroleuca]